MDSKKLIWGFLVSAAFHLGACSDGETAKPPGSESGDAPVEDSGAAAVMDAGAAETEPPTDAAVITKDGAATDAAKDAVATDASADTAAKDASSSAVVITIKWNTFSADLLGETAGAIPLHLNGASFTVHNNGTSKLGAITIRSGAVLDSTSTPVATFSLYSDSTVASVAAGTSETTKLHPWGAATLNAGYKKPTVLCNQTVVFEVIGAAPMSLAATAKLTCVS